MANIIPVSFKNNEREMELYNYLKEKSSPSVFIKEILEKHIEEEKNKGGNNNWEDGKKNPISGLSSLIK